MDTIKQEVKLDQKGELDALKAEFNKVQQGQRERLHKILELVKEGSGGGKEIRFGLNAWTNCWNLLPAAQKRMIDDWLLLITNINAGK